MPSGSVRRGAALAALVTSGAVVAPIALAIGLAASGMDDASADPPSPLSRAAGGLPAPPASAFSVGRPPPLSAAARGSLWATVRSGAVARAAPAVRARPLARLGARTPEGTAAVVPVLGRSRDAGGRLWIRVRLPVLPNGTAGWVRRSALGGYAVARAHLIVDTARLRATLLRDGRPLFRAPVGIGRARWPTPRGEFSVRSVLTRYRSAFYGPVAFGTSARSAVLTDWPAGGFIGIHGTDRPDLIPGRVSHGCIRMRNRDIVRLARLMPPGTPVTIR